MTKPDAIRRTDSSKDDLANREQEWPDSQHWAGMDLAKEYGSELSREASYLYEQRMQNDAMLSVHLGYNASLFREATGTDILNQPAEVRLNYKIGEGSDGVNPPVLAFRITDRGDSQTEIQIINSPLGKHGLTYDLEAVNGVVTHIDVEEFERPSKDNGWGTRELDKETLFSEDLVRDSSGEHAHNVASITDEQTITLLESLNLPTSWNNAGRKEDGSLDKSSIAPFPELLKRVEEFVIRLKSSDQGPDTPSQLTG